MKYIVLTDNNKGLPIVVNVEHLVSFKKANNGNDTGLHFSSGENFYVKESVEEITKMIKKVR